jgi:NAD+ kinase
MTTIVPTVKRIGLLHHPRVAASLTLAEELQGEVERLGGEAWLCSAWEEQQIRGEITRLDLLVTLGGDGTIMRAARVAAPQGVPILGVNMGSLGFLAELNPEFVASALPRLLAGQFWLEQRMMLRVEPSRGETSLSTFDALNDAVAARGITARAIRVAVRIDGEALTTYVADGVIAATPTGSTAYSLAAGGPIMAPSLRSILLVPIAPHLTMVRTLVLPEQAQINFEVTTEYDAVLTIDGQIDVPLQSGDRVHVAASPHNAAFARLRPPSYFYRLLLEQLGARESVGRGRPVRA